MVELGTRRIAVFVLSGYALFTVFRIAVGLILPDLSREFQLSSIEAGFFASSALLASVLVTAAAGYISDRIGTKRTLAIGNLALWVGVLLSSFSPNYLLALFFIFVAGIGAAFLPPTVYSLMGNLRAGSRGSLIGMSASAYNAGGFVGSISLGLVIAFFGWRLGLATLSGMGLIYLPVMFVFMGPVLISQSPKTEVSASSFSYSALLKSKNTMFAATSLFMATYASFTITSWTPTYLTYIGVDPTLIGVVIGVFYLGGAISAAVSGRLADAWGEKRLMILMGTIAGLMSIPFYLFQWNFTAAVILMFLIGFMFWPYWNLSISMIQRLVNPADVGSMTGLIMNIGIVGGFVGPFLTGVLIGYSSVRLAVFGSVAVSLLLYALLIVPFKEVSRERIIY